MGIQFEANDFELRAGGAEGISKARSRSRPKKDSFAKLMLTLVENLLVVCTGVVHQKLVPNSRMKNFQILLPVDTKSYIKTSVADPDLHESSKK